MNFVKVRMWLKMSLLDSHRQSCNYTWLHLQIQNFLPSTFKYHFLEILFTFCERRIEPDPLNRQGRYYLRLWWKGRATVLNSTETKGWRIFKSCSDLVKKLRGIKVILLPSHRNKTNTGNIFLDDSISKGWCPGW